MQIAPDKLRRYVNECLFPELEIEDTIGVTTATAWLKKLGYRLRRYQKGIYYDGHERPDVVQKRNEFIKDIFACLERVGTNGISCKHSIKKLETLISTKTKQRPKPAPLKARIPPAISRKFPRNSSLGTSSITPYSTMSPPFMPTNKVISSGKPTTSTSCGRRAVAASSTSPTLLLSTAGGLF